MHRPYRVSFASAFLLVGLTVAGPAHAIACFTPDEAKAAHFRTLQQELNVAALNCRTTDPADPSFVARYNDFVGRFSGKLKENAVALRRHFSRAGDNFDRWMTVVANDAGRRVFTESDYCQRAWDNLEKILVIEPQEVEGFASTAAPAHSLVPVCIETKQASVKGKI